MKIKMVRNMVFYCIIFYILFFAIQNCEAQWQQMNGPYGGYITCIATSGNITIAGTTDKGLYLTTNNGSNWNSVNNGLAYDSINKVYYEVNALAIQGNYIYAGVSNGDYRGGVYVSTNNGENWMAMNNGFINKEIHAIAINDTNIYAGSGETEYIYPQIMDKAGSN